MEKNHPDEQINMDANASGQNLNSEREFIWYTEYC